MLNGYAIVYLGPCHCSRKRILTTLQLLSRGVTVFHSPFHLQVHRMGKFTPESLIGANLCMFTSYSGLSSMIIDTRGFIGSYTCEPLTLTNIHLPNLKNLAVVYKDNLPIFTTDCTLGSQASFLSEKKSLKSSLSFIHLGCDDPAQTVLANPCQGATASRINCSNYLFVSNFKSLQVIGGPNSLITRMSLRNTKYLYWKIASEQLPNDLFGAFPDEIVASNLKEFNFETLLPNTVVPKVINLYCLVSMCVIPHCPGLQWNGILTDNKHSLGSVVLINRIPKVRFMKKRQHDEARNNYMLEIKRTDLPPSGYRILKYHFGLYGPFSLDFPVEQLKSLLGPSCPEMYFAETEEVEARHHTKTKLNRHG